MISLRIHHRTTYRYRSPVGFGQHRLMLRPREGRELRLIGFELAVAPQARVTWAHDVWGNAVATAERERCHCWLSEQRREPRAEGARQQRHQRDDVQQVEPDAIRKVSRLLFEAHLVVVIHRHPHFLAGSLGATGRRATLER